MRLPTYKPSIVAGNVTPAQSTTVMFNLFGMIHRVSVLGLSSHGYT